MAVAVAESMQKEQRRFVEEKQQQLNNNITATTTLILRKRRVKSGKKARAKAATVSAHEAFYSKLENKNWVINLTYQG